MVTMQELETSLMFNAMSAYEVIEKAFEDRSHYHRSFYSSLAAFMSGGVEFLRNEDAADEVEDTTRRILAIMNEALYENYIAGKLLSLYLRHGFIRDDLDNITENFAPRAKRMYLDCLEMIDECDTDEELSAAGAHAVGHFDGMLCASGFVHQLLTAEEPERDPITWWEGCIALNSIRMPSRENGEARVVPLP